MLLLEYPDQVAACHAASRCHIALSSLPSAFTNSYVNLTIATTGYQADAMSQVRRSFAKLAPFEA